MGIRIIRNLCGSGGPRNPERFHAEWKQGRICKSRTQARHWRRPISSAKGTLIDSDST